MWEKDPGAPGGERTTKAFSKAKKSEQRIIMYYLYTNLYYVFIVEIMMYYKNAHHEMKGDGMIMYCLGEQCPHFILSPWVYNKRSHQDIFPLQPFPKIIRSHSIQLPVLHSCCSALWLSWRPWARPGLWQDWKALLGPQTMPCICFWMRFEVIQIIGQKRNMTLLTFRSSSSSTRPRRWVRCIVRSKREF